MLHFQAENKRSKDTIRLPENFYQGLSALLLELGIDGHDFIEDFTKHYLQTAADKYSKSTDIYNATGFSEYTAKKHLEHKTTTNPVRKLYYYNLITTIKDLCEQSEDGCIPIYGKFNSFNATFSKCHATDNTITAPSMLKKLIKAGYIERVEPKKIKFISTLPKLGQNGKNEIIKLLSNLIYRASSTLLHNLLAKENKDTLFQMSYFSKLIHPDNFKKLSDELRTEQRKDYCKYQKIIDGYEEQGSACKLVESLNNEIGISSFIFNNSTQMRSKS